MKNLKVITFSLIVVCMSSNLIYAQIIPTHILEHPVSTYYPNLGITVMIFSPDEQWLVTHGRWTEIFIWDMKSGKLIRILKGPECLGSA